MRKSRNILGGVTFHRYYKGKWIPVILLRFRRLFLKSDLSWFKGLKAINYPGLGVFHWHSVREVEIGISNYSPSASEKDYIFYL